LKHLYLLRHAKSSWDDPNLPDHDRPLARRGETAGAAIAATVAALDPRPDLVLCSTAVRAQSTLALVRTGLRDAPVRTDPLVYAFEPLSLRLALEHLDETLGTVLIIGHNPALEMLAHDLAKTDTSPHMKRLRRKFPTASLAELDLAIDTWRDLASGTARLRRFTRPTDLTPA